MKKSGNLPQPSARDRDFGLKSEIWVFRIFSLATLALRHLVSTVYVCIEKIPRTREAQRLQTKGKMLNPHDMKLIDRQEKIAIEGDVYELTLIWNKNFLNRSAVGMPPDYAHIRKNGRNFALIGCSSNINGFFVEAFHLAMEPPAWQMKFNYLNINTIPFRDILVRLPL